tara:strand:- start:1283 stop:2065 length:783 start_codon:yes stop_codon:yes gene_type:complete
MLHQALALLLSLVIGIFSYKRKSITVSGFITLITICSLFVFTDKIELLAIIFYMFASSSLLTKIFPHDSTTEKIVAKSGARDYIQALANLGTATALFLLYILTVNNIFLIGMIGSVASANADCWASEIGGSSKKMPRMITNLKPIQKGISGGITLLGTMGGFFGCIFILLMSYLTIDITLQESLFSFNGIIATFIGGISGLFLDSYLGAWFQALYLKDNELTEKPNGHLTKGIVWINNDMVNFLSTLFASMISMLLFSII